MDSETKKLLEESIVGYLEDLKKIQRDKQFAVNMMRAIITHESGIALNAIKNDYYRDSLTYLEGEEKEEARYQRDLVRIDSEARGAAMIAAGYLLKNHFMRQVAPIANITLKEVMPEVFQEIKLSY